MHFGRASFLPPVGRQNQDFGGNLRLPIDERPNPCYNDSIYA